MNDMYRNLKQKKMGSFFWWLFGFDVIIAVFILYFFLAGLMDGTVSSFNAGIWLLLLLVAIGMPAISLLLRHNNQLLFAKVLLWVPAVPGLLYGLFILMLLIFSDSNWH